ncbi:MAG: hypothetical protein K0R27_4351 [Xanthobacteraceae bacterium]|nr:hypothetical protein [Xanthobacteraceae bacterium]
MTENDDERNSRLTEATDWLLRLNEAPRDPALARALDTWLAASDAHRDAFERASRVWQLMGEVPPAYAHVWQQRPGPRPTRRRPSWRAAAVVTAMAACLLALVFYPALLLRLQADYITPTGGSRTVTLEDGSVVELGAGSALAVDLSEGRRAVRLLAGEAFFEVRRDPARPFTVDAGGVDIEVLGTGFNVRLSCLTTSIELAHGAVALRYAAAGAEAQARLAPGEMAVVDRLAGTMETRAIAPEDIAAWRSGRLFVQDAAIGAVVEQLQRYHGAWISLPDGALAAQKVTGLYDLHDPDRALRALVQPYGGTVREISPYVRVLSRY